MENADRRFDQIRSALIDQGFPAVGAVDLDLAKSEFERHAQRYQAWIQRGMQGEMQYLERGLDRRMDPRLVFAPTQSVVTVLKPYDPRPIEQNGLKYARYLNQPDYHQDLVAGLEQVFSKISGVQYKICVDTSAVLERTWAAICGLGWIGKNTMLIHPQLGSYTFIGVVLTDLKLGRPPQMLFDYCGNCQKCLQACPTQAFLAPRDLDSKQCISYLTLEKRGPWSQKVNTTGYLGGCDRCQEVCPFNHKASKNAEQNWGEHEIHESLLLDAHQIEVESQTAYQHRVKGSALKRIKYDDFRRNWLASRAEFVKNDGVLSNRDKL